MVQVVKRVQGVNIFQVVQMIQVVEDWLGCEMVRLRSWRGREDGSICEDGSVCEDGVVVRWIGLSWCGREFDVVAEMASI